MATGIRRLKRAAVTVDTRLVQASSQGRPRLVAWLMLVGVAAVLATAALQHAGVISMRAGAAAVVVLNAAAAALAAALQIRAARRLEGRQRRVWTCFARGCTVWALGAVPYLAFLAGGGSLTEPPAWSQAGFVLAYIPWFHALWLLRQPVVAESRWRKLETLAMEAAAFAVIGTLVLGVMWYRPLGAAQNSALLVPVALDLLLVAAAYNAVRRASLERASAYPWLAGAFLTLAAGDATVSALVARDHTALTPIGLSLYCVVFGLLALSAGRPLLAREVALAGERVGGAVASIGLAVAAPASTLVPQAAAPMLWLLGGALAWRVHALLRRQGRTDEDLITGLHDARAMHRHLSGMVAGASAREPVGVIAVDLNGFGAWNAAHGFSAGDALLAEVAETCARSAIGPGVWGRIGPDRFCWVGRVADAAQARASAEAVVAAAARNTAGLGARGAVVMSPADAATAANVEAAIAEALEAASLNDRDVVAFDRGLLDGAAAEGSYSASFRSRRERIAQVIGDPAALRPVFQPIVRMDTLKVMGHEALSRFELEPRRGPDQWIGEAHQVGLGLELEAECLRRAVARRDEIPGSTYLSLNASPQLILSGQLDQLMPAGRLDWLLIEITEHEQVQDYGQLADRLGNLRSRGARVAVDDLGAGHSTLRHLMRLRPDYAKLDRSIVQEIDADPAKQALVRSMVAFGREMDTVLVSEGVETLAELEVLRDIGVELGQGYLFRRPAAEMTGHLAAVAPGLVPRIRPAVPEPDTRNGTTPLRAASGGPGGA
ncbi:MAG: GGDEF domain-containing protein [Thermoleophilia bacterium]|nr:GGDEF domain-containing protein [Thermoleophilia bacterium]